MITVFVDLWGKALNTQALLFLEQQDEWFWKATIQIQKSVLCFPCCILLP